MSDRRAQLFDQPRFDQPGEDLRRITDAIRNEDRAPPIEVMSRHAVLFRSRLSGLIEGTMQFEFESI